MSDGADGPDGLPPDEEPDQEPEPRGTSWRHRSYRAVERLVGASRMERVLLSGIALVLAILIGMVFVFASGFFASCKGDAVFAAIAGAKFCYNPFEVYMALLDGALGSAFGIATTLQATSILILTGLSVAISFRAGLFNIGTQGQMIMGALVTGVVGAWLVPFFQGGLVGSIVVIGACLLTASIVGGVWGAIPGILKAYADANVVITTIMLNTIAAGIAFTLVNEYINPGGNIQTDPLPSWAMFKPLLAPSGSRFSVLVLLGALLIAGFVWYILNYTTFGYNLRVSGLQPEAANYSGVDAKRVIVSTMTVAGVFGGLAGAAFVLMALGYWTDGLPAYGFDGITVSVLAMNSPLGVIPASLLFGMLRSGTVGLQLQVDVPPQIASVLRGLIILLVAMPEFIRMVAIRSGITALEEDEGVNADA